MSPEVQAIYDEIMNAPGDGIFPQKRPLRFGPRTEGRRHPSREQLAQASPRFIDKIDRRGLFECWDYRGKRSEFGHGLFSIGGRSLQAHRIAYLIWRGHFNPNLVIRHRCDNPPCCNPAHLVPGTAQQNVDDMVGRGRAAFQRPGWRMPSRPR